MEPTTNPETSEPSSLHARILLLAAHQPAKIFFGVGAAGIAVLFFAFRLQRMLGNTPYNSQSSLERGVRMMAGMFSTMVPYFLFYALIYWLLHRFDRPTSPRLNVVHILLTVAGYGGILLYSGWQSMSGHKFYTTMLEDNPSDILFAILFFLIWIVFIVNVVAALLKKRIDW